MRVLDTLARECEATTCASEPAGSAIATVDGSLQMRRFEVAGARLCGAQIAGMGELDLREGTITETLVGACVQRDGYDVVRLTDGVSFEANGTNVQTTMHSVPPSSDPLAGFSI